MCTQYNIVDVIQPVLAINCTPSNWADTRLMLADDWPAVLSDDAVRLVLWQGGNFVMRNCFSEVGLALRKAARVTGALDTLAAGGGRGTGPLGSRGRGCERFFTQVKWAFLCEEMRDCYVNGGGSTTRS